MCILLHEYTPPYVLNINICDASMSIYSTLPARTMSAYPRVSTDISDHVMHVCYKYVTHITFQLRTFL